MASFERFDVARHQPLQEMRRVLAADADPPAVLVHDGVRDRQPEAAAHDEQTIRIDQRVDAYIERIAARVSDGAACESHADSSRASSPARA